MDDRSDPFQLQRFVEAQERTCGVALAEIQSGLKQSHWIWFVFPQLADLGRSPTAQFYGIRSLQEARAYLAQPVLAELYREAVRALLSWAGSKSAEQILGETDAMKLRSSLTLFEAASGDPLFTEALSAFFGKADEATLRILGRG